MPDFLDRMSYNIDRVFEQFDRVFERAEANPDWLPFPQGYRIVKGKGER